MEEKKERKLYKKEAPTPYDLTPDDMPLQVFSSICQEPKTADRIAEEIQASSTAKVHHVLNVLRAVGLVQYHSYEKQPPTRQSRKKQHFRTEAGRVQSIAIHNKLVQQGNALKERGEEFRQR